MSKTWASGVCALSVLTRTWRHRCNTRRLRSTRSPEFGQVAQLVEQRTENPRVGGSIPPLATTPPCQFKHHLAANRGVVRGIIGRANAFPALRYRERPHRRCRPASRAARVSGMTCDRQAARRVRRIRTPITRPTPRAGRPRTPSVGNRLCRWRGMPIATITATVTTTMCNRARCSNRSTTVSGSGSSRISPRRCRAFRRISSRDRSTTSPAFIRTIPRA